MRTTSGWVCLLNSLGLSRFTALRAIGRGLEPLTPHCASSAAAMPAPAGGFSSAAASARCDGSGGLRFKLSNWVDRTVAFFRGNRLPPLHCCPLTNWIQSLEALGFSVETEPMNGDLPFVNVMLVACLN